MEELTINGQTFQLQKSEGDGNCLLYTLLNYLNAKGIDPFLGGGGNKSDVIAYRQFLLKTEFRNTFLRNLQQKVISDQKRNYLVDCAWLTTDILSFVVALYTEIEKIYVFDRSDKSWRSYSFDGNRVQMKPVTTSFNFTDRMMMVQYNVNHFDLLKPNNNRVVVKRKRSAETPEQKMKRNHEVQFRNKALTIELNRCYYEKLNLQTILDNSDNNSYDIDKKEIQNQINKVEEKMKQIQRELQMKQQKLDNEKTIDLRDESPNTESGTSSDNPIPIEDDKRKIDLIQNRSLMSLSRMRL